MDPGQRDRLITIERGTPTVDDHGGETMAWATYATAWARVRYGSGQERREAAQERADQAATFECEYNPTLAAVATTDRIQFDGVAWDVTSKALIGRAREIHFAAVRSA